MFRIRLTLALAAIASFLVISFTTLIGQQTTNQAEVPFDSSFPLENSKGIGWSEVPEVAQETFHWHADGAEIRDVHSATLSGVPVFVGTFTDEGVTVRLAVDNSGSVRAVENLPPAIVTVATIPRPVSTNQPTNAVAGNRTLAAVPVTNFIIVEAAGAEAEPPPEPPLAERLAADLAVSQAVVEAQQESPVVQFTELPPVVQERVQFRVDTGRIQSIARDTYNGQPTYRVTVQDRGLYQQIWFSEDGLVVHRVGISGARAR